MMEAHVATAIHAAHNAHLAELNATILRYRELLEQAGVDPPDTAGADALIHFRHLRYLAARAWELLEGKVTAEELRADYLRLDLAGPRLFLT